MSGVAGDLPGGFSRRAVAWITGLATGSFLLALLLAVYGAELGRPPTPHANSFSTSALGHRGAVELLRAAGLGVYPRQNRAGIGTGPETPLLAAEPDPATLEGEGARRLRALLAEVSRQGTALVLVLPKWHGRPDPAEPRWLDAVALLPAEEVGRVLAAFDHPVLGRTAIERRGVGRTACSGPGLDGRTFAVELEPAQLLRPAPGLVPLVRCGEAVLVGRVEATDGPSPLVVVSDPDLLNNQGLGRADHAALVVSLLTSALGAGGVVFDETVHGFVRSGGLLAELLAFPLLPATLHGLLTAGLVLWAGMGRFGSPRPAPAGLAAGKELLIDNTAALLAAGGHGAASLRRYLRQTVRETARALHLPDTLGESATVKRLQQLAAGRGVRGDLPALEAQVRTLPAAGGPRSTSRAVRLARELHRWRREMTGRETT